MPSLHNRRRAASRPDRASTPAGDAVDQRPSGDREASGRAPSGGTECGHDVPDVPWRHDASSRSLRARGYPSLYIQLDLTLLAADRYKMAGLGGIDDGSTRDVEIAWRREHAGSGLTSRLILTYVEREAGGQAVERMLALAGLSDAEERLRDENRWFSYETKLALCTPPNKCWKNPADRRARGRVRPRPVGRDGSQAGPARARHAGIRLRQRGARERQVQLGAPAGGPREGPHARAHALHGHRRHQLPPLRLRLHERPAGDGAAAVRAAAGARRAPCTAAPPAVRGASSTSVGAPAPTASHARRSRSRLAPPRSPERAR